ncbi:MAG: hypothetical protein ACTSR5_10060 [Promethearchaeota archaeon]
MTPIIKARVFNKINVKEGKYKMINEAKILNLENINRKNQGKKKKIIQVETEQNLVEILQQYCAIKKWSQNYFIINAIKKELIEEFVFIQQCGEYLDENEIPIDFTLFTQFMEDYIEKEKHDSRIQTKG